MPSSMATTGPPGPPGPSGARGLTGLTGASGASGARGLQGLQGTSGASGARGASGPPGTGSADPTVELNRRKDALAYFKLTTQSELNNIPKLSDVQAALDTSKSELAAALTGPDDYEKKDKKKKVQYCTNDISNVQLRLSLNKLKDDITNLVTNPTTAQTVFDNFTSTLQGLGEIKPFSRCGAKNYTIDILKKYSEFMNNLNQALLLIASTFGVTYTPVASTGGRRKGSRKRKTRKGRKGRKGRTARTARKRSV